MNNKELREKYLYKADASEVIKKSKSRLNKDVIALTKLPVNRSSLILPSFTAIKDGWTNLLSGLGGTNSKTNQTTYTANYAITDYLLLSLFATNGLCRKIIDVVADDSTKNDIEIENDSEHDLLNKWTKLKAIKNFNMADKYRRGFAGSVIVMGINDGKELHEPVNENAIKSIDWLRTYSRTDIFFTTIHFTQDIQDPNYGQPEIYTIIPKYSTPFNVHHSRILEFKGMEVPTSLDNGYRFYWGQSVVEPIWETLKKVGAGFENLDQLLYEMTISIYSIKGLADLMCAGEWDRIKKIIDTTDMAKSTIRSILVDAEGHSYKRDSLNFTGADTVLELFLTLLSGESTIPILRLLEKQLGGLNNEAKGELTIYYDRIKAHCKNDLQPQAQRLINLINLSDEIKNKVEDPIVQFSSPWQMTQKEELENRKIQAEIDNIYIDKSVVSNQEVREQRFYGGYSHEMSVEDEMISEEELTIEEPSV